MESIPMHLDNSKYLAILLCLTLSAQAHSETPKVELNAYQEVLQLFDEIGYTSEQLKEYFVSLGGAKLWDKGLIIVAPGSEQ